MKPHALACGYIQVSWIFKKGFFFVRNHLFILNKFLLWTKQLKKFGVGFGVMILKDNKLLLGKRHENPEKADSELHWKGTWTMLSGKLDFGESFEEGAKRETLEETGVKLNKLDGFLWY